MTSLAFAYTGPHSWPTRRMIGSARWNVPRMVGSARWNVPRMVGSAFHRRPPRALMWWVRTAMERRPYRVDVMADGDGTPSLPDFGGKT